MTPLIRKTWGTSLDGGSSGDLKGTFSLTKQVKQAGLGGRPLRLVTKNTFTPKCFCFTHSEGCNGLLS